MRLKGISQDVFRSTDTVLVAPDGESRCCDFAEVVRQTGAATVVVEPDVLRGELLDTVFVSESKVLLRDTKAVAAWLRSFAGRVIVDITCLPHAVWSAVVRAALLEDVAISASYIEPDRYEEVQLHAGGRTFDLTLSIGGLGPLPGFSRISTLADEQAFVFLLGFEGDRVGHMAAALGVGDSVIAAVVGDPGLRPGYEETAREGNRAALMKLGVNVDTDLLNCDAADVLALVETLRSISRQSGDKELTVIPLGPRPHALGAVLYYLEQEMRGGPRPRIVYDHAVRDPGSSTGMGVVHLYDLTRLTRGANDGQL